ncbi:hypothetical protein SDC9_160794 [bioreactor metagenome]|uniref:Uncharacterized protein n=1 Tax=bioreactor metagenome TaxID=1076179 RepID=A0A645FMP7_9ZZZZ
MHHGREHKRKLVPAGREGVAFLNEVRAFAEVLAKELGDHIPGLLVADDLDFRVMAQ